MVTSQPMCLRPGRRRAAQKRGVRVLEASILLVAACLVCFHASQAFVEGPRPTLSSAGLVQQATPATKPVAYATFSSTASASNGAVPFACSLGSIVLLAAYASLRATKSSARPSTGRVVVAATASQFESQMPSPPKIAAVPAVAPQACLMMAEVEVAPQIAEAPAVVPPSPAPAAAALPTPAMSVAAAATVEPKSEQSFTSSAARNRAGSARFVGGARRASSRGSSRGASAARKAARRSVGARLQAQAPQVVSPAPSFDASRLRLKIQTGLSTSSSVRSEHGRESRTPSANKGTCISADARIQEKDLGEHLEQDVTQQQ
eukprot:gb/GFBE01062282.1/.p1 GENE.gb/GFBE01062282.1/~~gb/GFBE01062282.1/.p1  ORF type:complete len:319 (+),score=35.93 gb/GFBE01062282.1/:1-957(+)